MQSVAESLVVASLESRPACIVAVLAAGAWGGKQDKAGLRLSEKTG